MILCQDTNKLVFKYYLCTGKQEFKSRLCQLDVEARLHLTLRPTVVHFYLEVLCCLFQLLGAA